MDKFKPIYLWLYNRQLSLCKILFLMLVPAVLSDIFTAVLIVSTFFLQILFSYGHRNKWWEDAE